jgi:hypothetical protein
MTRTICDRIPARELILAELSADLLVRDYGTMWAFIPRSPSATEVLAELETESWQWSGDNLLVDHRPARALLSHLETATDLDIFLV